MAEAATPTMRDVNARMCFVHKSAVVSPLAVVGAPAEHRSLDTRFPANVGPEVTIREFVRVHAGCVRATMIGRGTLLMAGSHVGHDSVLGAGCEVAPNAVIGGHCTLGEGVRIGMGAVLRPGVEVGANARIGAGAVVTKSVPPGETWVGTPARRLHKWKGAA